MTATATRTPKQLRRLELLQHTRCEHCSLCGGKQPREVVGGIGPVDARIVVVGEAPGKHEMAAGRPFIGESGNLLWHTFSQYGIWREEVYATNVLMCPSIVGKQVKPKDVEACSGRLEAELAALHPKVIIALGTPATSYMRGTPSKVSEFSGHNEWNERYQCHVVYCWHPAAVLRNPDLYPDFDWAIRHALELLEAPWGQEEPKPIHHYVATAENALEVLEWLREAQHIGEFVCDLETTGLYPHTDRIRSIGLCWSDDTAYIIPGTVAMMPSVRPVLTAVLEAAKMTGHNFKFDCHFLRAQMGIHARVGGDTLLMHYAMDERSGGEGGGFHDLKTLARKYCDAPMYAENVDTAHTERVSDAILYEYQANDLVYTYRLQRRLRKLLLDQPHSREGFPEPIDLYTRLLLPAANAILDMEERGVTINVRRLLSVEEDFKRQMEASQALAQDQLRELGVWFSSSLNLASPQQVAQVLYSDWPTGMGYPQVNKLSTDEATIHELQRHDKSLNKQPNPFLETLMAYRSQKHTISTYTQGILKQLMRGNPDGRLRPNFLLHGTSSGRLSSRPNVQNMPADSVIKELFVPKQGSVLLNADYKRLEVGILAYCSKDPALTKDFMSDDFHWSVAQKVFSKLTVVMDHHRDEHDLPGLEYLCGRVSFFADFARRQATSARTDDPEVLYDWMKTRLRRQSKYVSFGIMYGEGAYTLSQEEKGLGVSQPEAQAYIDMWHASYPIAIAYLDQQVAYARKEQWVESNSGRRRHFAYPLEIARRQSNEAKNHPIQAFASDVCLLSQIKLNQMLPDMGLGDVLLSVHDSILFELVTATLPQAKTVIHDVMTGIVTDDPTIVFEVDMFEGKNWGDCHEHKPTKAA